MYTLVDYSGHNLSLQWRLRHSHSRDIIVRLQRSDRCFLRSASFLTNVTEERSSRLVHTGTNVSKEEVLGLKSPYIERKRNANLFLKNIAHHFKDYFIRELRSLVGISSFRHLIISVLAFVEEQHYRQRLAPLPPD